MIDMMVEIKFIKLYITSQYMPNKIDIYRKATKNFVISFVCNSIVVQIRTFIANFKTIKITKLLLPNFVSHQSAYSSDNALCFEHDIKPIIFQFK